MSDNPVATRLFEGSHGTTYWRVSDPTNEWSEDPCYRVQERIGALTVEFWTERGWTEVVEFDARKYTHTDAVLLADQVVAIPLPGT